MTTPANSPETNYQTQIQTWLKHIHLLAEEIGPRGPTTEGEARGTYTASSQYTGLVTKTNIFSK